MKQFSCGDVVPGCNASFRGADEEEILAAVAVHAREAHGITFIPVALLTQVRSLIQNVSAQ